MIDLHRGTPYLQLALSLVLLSACDAETRSAPPPRLQLFLLAGQSNMAGRGVVEARDRVKNAHVVMLDRSMHWVPTVDPVHFDKPFAGVGPGHAFALALAADDSDINIGLVPAAVGGSPISAWEPGALDSATGTHPYDDAIARARAAMEQGELKAILWHQGESDANEHDTPLYAERLRALIQRFRTDLDNPELPVIVGELGRFDSKPWDASHEAIDSVYRALPSQVPHTAFVSAEGLKDMGDATHFTAESARELGVRFAAVYLELISH